MRNIFIKILSICALGTFISTAQAKENITFMLDWFVNPDHGNIIIAKQKGYFADEGLNVDIKEPADPTDPPKFTAVKKVDYAINYQHVLQMQASEGWPNVRIGTIISSPLNTLVSVEKSGIKTIADLKGKTIGYSLPGFEDAILGTMLETHGVSLSEVKLVNVNWALAPSLITGKVDAVIGAYRNFEKHKLEMEGFKPVMFFPEQHGVPTFDEMVLITHKDNAKSETSKKILRAMERATRYMKNYPKESWEVFKAYKPDVLDTELNYRAWFDTLRRFASAPGALDYQRYLRMAEFLEQKKLVKNPVPSIETYAIDPFKP